MAVEARRLNLFPSQILSNTRGMAAMNGNIEGVYGAPMMGYGGVVAPPLSGTTTATEMLAPMYDSEAFPAKISAIKSDSGLSYAVPVSRKRPRDASTNQMLQNVVVSNNFDINNSTNNRCGSITFLGEDFSFQFQQQQLEIDRFIAQHTEKVRLEVEERRKRYSRRIAAAVEENVMKRLRAKEEEIERMGKLNWALEERVRSLCVENQIWRDLAQTNEATANALRCNLEQVLAQAAQDDAAAIADEEAESSSSCCGSNNSGDDVRMTTAMCRSCGKEESSVLLLPCRHLCLCTLCGSSLQTCPVCNSPQTASVHVNLSPT